MNRWEKKVAVVTGASSGIGAEIAKDLAKAGMVVVGLARRVEKVEELRKQLSLDDQKLFHPVKCDVTREEEIIEVFAWIEQNLGGVDVLINNAGIGRTDKKLVDADSDLMRSTVDTNLLGVVFCTREAFQSMKRRSSPGHIININSILGHTIPMVPQEFGGFNFNIYPATKFGVTALTEMYRQEFFRERFGVKITSISPGVVQTEIGPAFTEEALKHVPHLKPGDISAAVLYTLSTPAHVNVQELLIRPTCSF
ncbi:farnesol dehydrogenase-like [Phlebotomus argentipes]|uniref:farnesol dehydrogenase-like n=1 Tax=Phlebotomus argentipes TaxID=94469 RepID=UPI002892D810|nr:farnesol dehydrogenase-like [Phlebotomus argentipes]